MRPTCSWTGRALLALLCAALCLQGCGGRRRSTPAPLAPPIASSDFGEMRNVSLVGRLWFGAVPAAGDLALARRRGVARVIDLTSPSERSAEDLAAECKRLGLEYLGGVIRGEDPQGDDSVDLVLPWLAAADAAADAPWTLLFDGTGGRCAAYLAIHRAVVRGVPVEEALVEARRAGMKPGVLEDFVREQVARLASGDPGGVSEPAPAD